MSARIGIDLGGTKIEGVLLHADGRLDPRLRIATPQDDYQATLDAIAGLVDHLDPGGRLPVGIGSPGARSPETGLLRNSNSTCLNGQPLLDDLQARLGRPVRLANDADCFALSEASDGAAAGARSVFGVIIGTGTGAGIVIDGRLLAGPNAIAGEWGHNPLPWPVHDELPGPLLLWPARLHRDLPLRPRHGARPWNRPGQPRHRGRGRGRRSARPHYPGPLPRPAGTRPGLGHQPARPRGDRARRRHGPDPLTLQRAAPAAAALPVLGHPAHPHRAPRHGDASGVRGAAWLWSLEEVREFA